MPTCQNNNILRLIQSSEWYSWLSISVSERVDRYPYYHVLIGHVVEFNLQFFPYPTPATFCALRASLASDRRSRKVVYAVFKLPIYLQMTQIPRYGNCLVFGAMIKWCWPVEGFPRFRTWNNKCSSPIDSFLYEYCPYYPFCFVRIFPT